MGRVKRKKNENVIPGVGGRGLNKTCFAAKKQMCTKTEKIIKSERKRLEIENQTKTMRILSLKID